MAPWLIFDSGKPAAGKGFYAFISEFNSGEG
jgi:hypothetical protein